MTDPRPHATHAARTPRGSGNMQADGLISFVTTDIAGITRGRSFPPGNIEKHMARGVGWVPANLALTPFDVIADPNPWGSTGDLRLMPDPESEIRVVTAPDRPALHFYHCDITQMDGGIWDCCVRGALKRVLDDFERVAGLRVVATFEQEFQIVSCDLRGAPAFSLRAQRSVEPFASAFVGALEQAGCEPETFLPEYGKGQYEISTSPAPALAAADRAVTVRLLADEVAALYGWKASFAPRTAAEGVGNGVHIHLSFTDLEGNPATFDASRPGRISKIAGAFAAGVVRHLPALVAFTAPSPISYLRLIPHHWSAAYTCFGECNREATLRICPTLALPGSDPARQMNLEFRAADACASPHLCLAALLQAGLEGIRRGLSDPPLINEDPSTMTDRQRAELGVNRLPESLEGALAALKEDGVMTGWLPGTFLECYLAMKNAEIAATRDLTPAQKCDRYASIY